MKKLSRHCEMFKDIDFARINEEPKNFLIAANFLRGNNRDIAQYPPNFLEVPLDEHPYIMRDLLQRGVYEIRDEVKELIRKG
jgi:hypothetical protein